MTVLPNESRAVTVTVSGVPAVVVVVELLTVKCVAAPKATVIGPVVPLIEEVTVSVAVTVCGLPAVSRVTEKMLVPLARVPSGGRTAFGSVLVT